ncbi:MAG: HD domain-containing protein, partial [Flavisolibacter sp.]
MNESHEQILSKARHFVTELFTHHVKPQFVFHNLDHTESVADAASQMSDYYRLNDDDTFVLMLAAWFHDTGYSSGKVEGHEEISVQIATQFLQQHAVPDLVQQRVTSCIRATHMPQSPISQVEKI